MSRRIIIDELEFEVPYGRLAAKSWHEDTDECKRVLLLHGWMDNAGSFDNLVPHLKHKDGLYIVALDLPGHGKSSQIPPGSSYSDLSIILEIRRCLIELNWIKPTFRKSINGDSSGSFTNEDDAFKNDQSGYKKFSIIGHSLGAGLGLFYASLYPSEVEELIMLDFIKSRTTESEEFLCNLAKTIDQFISVVTPNSPISSPKLTNAIQPGNSAAKQADKGQVVVSQEAAIIATIEAHKQLGVLTRDEATCLLKRSTVAVSTPPNSVIYSRDLRLQAMLNVREHWNINEALFAGIRCHAISLLSKTGIYVASEPFKDRLDKMEEYLKSKAKSFNIQWMNADHYLHMNKPQQTADVINKYLENPAEYKVASA